MILLPLLLGCGDFLALQAAFEDFTNPLVVQSWYVGVEPLPEGLEISDGAWASGSTARVLLADASSLENLADAPVDDAAVAIAINGEDTLLRLEAAGSFVGDSTDGLGWTSGSEAELLIERDDEPHRISLVTPSAPRLSMSESHTRGEPLVIDLAEQEYDNLLVTVIRLEDGATVYDSTPTDIEALYRLTHSAGELVVEVPGSAFVQPGAYAVGVAGLVNADPDDYEGVNLALSALTAGSLSFQALAVAP